MLFSVSDHVYLDNSRTDQPYFICAIEGLKLVGVSLNKMPVVYYDFVHTIFTSNMAPPGG